MRCGVLAVGILGVGGWPAAATAITFPGFEHALPLAPGDFAAGAGLAGGDETLTVFAQGRAGLVEEFDLAVRTGVTTLELPGDDQTGFELEGALRARFLRAENTGFVDVAGVGAVSLLRTDDVFALGVDPMVVASHHFALDEERALFVALGAGAALTWSELDGDADLDLGLLLAPAVGVDVVPAVRALLEFRIRDDLERFGLAVEYHF